MEEFIPLYAKERSLWGINTHPLFLALYYQITHLISPEVPPLLHYTLSAPEISLHPHPLLKGVIDIPKFLDTPWQDRQETFTAFDQRWYLTQYPDLRASGIDPLMHFAQYGWKEGRDPNSAVRGNLLIKSLGDAISPFLYFIVLEKLAEQFNHA